MLSPDDPRHSSRDVITLCARAGVNPAYVRSVLSARGADAPVLDAQWLLDSAAGYQLRPRTTYCVDVEALEAHYIELQLEQAQVKAGGKSKP